MINPRNSHSPLPDDRRRRCPVCRQSVYSKAGIHPQCAIKQSDPLQPEEALEGDESVVEVAPKVAAPKLKPKPKFKATSPGPVKVRA